MRIDQPAVILTAFVTLSCGGIEMTPIAPPANASGPPSIADFCLKVTSPQELGSGVLIGPDLVLTAAHVIAPDPSDIDCASLAVSIPNVDWSDEVVEVFVDERWAHDKNVYADIAILRIASKGHDAASVVIDHQPDSSPSYAAFGYTVDHRHGIQKPTNANAVLTRSANESLAAFLSSTLSPEPGMSGGPLFRSIDGRPVVVGVTTHTQSDDGFVGVPLLASTFGALWQRASKHAHPDCTRLPEDQ